MERREFLKKAGYAAAGIVIGGQGLSASSYRRIMGANDRVNVAVVGYSDRFRQTLLPCFLHHNKELGFDLVAVADLWKKRLFENAKPEIEKAIGPGVETFGSGGAA
mgnify:CR=1 FL=1